ncbi:MAG: hypothetical protein IK990_14825 [Ruminiclostridium sp.]|nr:hypothetical protein [Ruminiclostridium sp.]
MKRKFKLLAAALAAITAMSCTSATAFADKVNTAQKPIVDNDQVTIWVDNDDLQISRENQNEYFHNFVDVCTKGFRTEKEMISEVCRAEFTYNATYFLTLEQLEYFRSNKPGIVTIHYSENKYADSLPEELKYNKEPGYFRMFAVLSNDIVVEKAYNVETRNHYTVQEFIKEAVEYGDVVLVVFDMEEYPYAIDGFDITNCSIGWNTVNGEKYYVRKDGTLATKACTINGRLYKFDKSGICKGKYTGWAKTSKGKLYYKNGVKVTKNTTIGGVRYKFSSDGYCKGKFTGLTKSSQGRKHWSKGILTKDEWVQDPKGDYYYAGSDGYLLTGWQKVTRIGGTYSYFDENGVWDGKIHKNGYVRNDLRSVFKDYDFFAGEKYYYNFNNHSADKMKPLDGVDVLREIIEKDLDTPLLWADFDDDEIEPPDELYYGGRKIVIRSSVSNNIDFEITRDNDGNSYLYNAYFGFGLKLTDSDAYDKIMVLLTFQG